MKAREIVKEIMSKKNLGNADFARILDITPATLWDRLNTKKAKDIPVSTLNEMLKALNYKIAITPKEAPVCEDSYVVGDENS